jgi:hypothetical protein
MSNAMKQHGNDEKSNNKRQSWMKLAMGAKTQ